MLSFFSSRIFHLLYYLLSGCEGVRPGTLCGMTVSCRLAYGLAIRSCIMLACNLCSRCTLWSAATLDCLACVSTEFVQLGALPADPWCTLWHPLAEPCIVSRVAVAVISVSQAPPVSGDAPTNLDQTWPTLTVSPPPTSFDVVLATNRKKLKLDRHATRRLQ